MNLLQRVIHSGFSTQRNGRFAEAVRRAKREEKQACFSSDHGTAWEFNKSTLAWRLNCRRFVALSRAVVGEGVRDLLGGMDPGPAWGPNPSPYRGGLGEGWSCCIVKIERDCRDELAWEYAYAGTGCWSRERPVAGEGNRVPRAILKGWGESLWSCSSLLARSRTSKGMRLHFFTWFSNVVSWLEIQTRPSLGSCDWHQTMNMERELIR